MAALARRVLDAAGEEPFAFVGLSLGGAVGMRLALDAPGRVERLVLACTSARFGAPEQWLERAEVVRREGLGAIVDTILGRWFTPAFADRGRYRALFLATDPEGYARCCEALAGWDAREELGAIAVPTLVVSGAEDAAAPPEAGALVAERIPGARHVVLEDAAHLANVERPDAFNPLLEEFL
jgi:3-oxoadipate enol-lactonase